MSESPKESKSEIKRSRLMAAFLNNFLVIRSSIALTLFVFSFAFFVFVLREGGDLGRIFIAFYGFIMLILCWMVIGEFVLKTIRLQRAELVRSYSAIVSVNSFFGLIIPLFFLNIILAVVMRFMLFMTYYGTIFCKIRMSLVHFYYNTNIFQEMNTIIFWIIIFGLILFIFGGLFERVWKNR